MVLNLARFPTFPIPLILTCSAFARLQMRPPGQIKKRKEGKKERKKERKKASEVEKTWKSDQIRRYRKEASSALLLLLLLLLVVVVVLVLVVVVVVVVLPLFCCYFIRVL